METRLSAKDFYKNAKKSILTNNQFYFDARHVYANAKRKLPCLKRLPELTNEMVCVLKKYGNHVAVDHLSFRLEPGKIYGFLGPNGAGKSTTMNMLTGYLGATSGEIKIDGHDIYKEPEEAKRNIGYLPELPPVYDTMTVMEYLAFVAELKKIDKKERRKQIGEVMELTKITSMQDRLIQNLSKGYKQRVGLAQAILGYPKIIILDEPTVGLDPMQIIEIRQLIKSLGKKHTVILSSHILPEVSAVCDHIMIIAHGRLAASDTPENLSRLKRGDNGLSMQLCGTEDAVRAAEKELKERYAAIGEMHASYNVENDLWQMELHYNKEEDLREEIFYYMAEHRLPIYEMKMTSKSLEDVFLELTKEQEKSAAAEEMTGRTAKESAAAENSQTAETTQKEETDNAGNMEKGI